MLQFGLRRLLLGIIVFLTVSVSAGPVRAGGSASSARFHRGIAISNALEWAQVEPGPAGTFVFPPFADPSHALTLDELNALRRTGFDFVRLAVDPGPFLQFQGTRRDALDRILIDRVKRILSSGLAVVVDLHPSDIQPEYTAQALTADPDAPVFRAYLRLVERTAALLAKLHTGNVALELMNEPPVAPQVWQPMLEAAYAAARRGAPDLFLVFDGGDEASAAALMAMRTTPFAKDQKVAFSFHYYDPYQFTHQGASWNAARHLTDVPFPARARPLQDSLSATAAGIAQSPMAPAKKVLAEADADQRLQGYWDSGFDADTIAARFAQIAAWARSQGLPPQRVMLGEFGAIDNARPVDRAQWFHAVRRQAESNGFGWAAWTFREGSFALTADGAIDIDPAIAQALGLKPQQVGGAGPGGPAADIR